MEDRLSQSGRLGLVGHSCNPSRGRCTLEDQLKVSQGYLEACLGSGDIVSKTQTPNKTKTAPLKALQIYSGEGDSHSLA